MADDQTKEQKLRVLIQEAICSVGPDYKDMESITASLVAGLFLKTDFGPDVDRVEEFDAFIDRTRDLLISEIANGEAWTQQQDN